MNTNVVTIGGGGGHAQVLKGIKQLPDVTITGICPSTDSGGSTERLKNAYGSSGFLGDLTKCVAALCPHEKLAAALLKRHPGELNGHSFKNLLMFGLNQEDIMTLDEALAHMYRMCDIGPHRVLPVTTERVELDAWLKFGGKVSGETNIDNLAKNPLWSADTHAIKNVCLSPAVQASKQALQAINEADEIAICPGDLYSSIVPAILPLGMKSALRKAKARITMILNIMTKRGETDGYRAEDFVREIERRIGRPCDAILYNSTPIPNASLARYRKKEQKVQLSSGKLKHDPRVIHTPLMGITPEGYLYHDPDAVRDAFKALFR